MIGIISISKQGNALASRLSGLLGNSTCYTLEKWNLPDFTPIRGSLKDFSCELFIKHESLIFIMASGIVVRSIAPWIKDKTTDPAIVVIDDKGKNVISLLSGHWGGANALCESIASKIAANPVITTASDVNNLPSVDMLALSKGLVIDSMEDAKRITAMIVNGEHVELVDDSGVFNKSLMPISGEEYAGKIIITNRQNIKEHKPYAKLIPKNIVLGIGCKKDTEAKGLIDFVNDTIKHFNIDKRSINTIASISIKKYEKAILEAADKINCQLKFYDVETLQKVDHLFEGSGFVRSVVGVSSVSATAAYIAGKQKGVFIVEKEIRNGMTISIFEQKIA